MKIVKLSKTRPRGRASGVAAVALAVLAATSGAALAAARGEPGQSYVVRYGDLHPERPADAAKLLRRVEYAAGQVCGTESAPDLSRRAVYRHCRTDAIARAVREANLPMVTALAQRSTRPVTLAGE